MLEVLLPNYAENISKAIDIVDKLPARDNASDDEREIIDELKDLKILASD